MGYEAADIRAVTGCPRVSEDFGGSYRAAMAQVIECAKDGDHLAFEQLITWHQQRVVGLAWKMLGNQEDALDAAQEVFLKVYRYLKSFREGEDFSAWLYRIVINVCRDTRRRRASYESEIERGRVAEMADKVDIEATAMLSQERAIVADALNTLSRREREAIVLRDLEGLSTDEVARILGSSPATVRSQISTGRTKIKLYRERLLNRRRTS